MPSSREFQMSADMAICDAEGLIGREMFAIDGVKLPSNASKHRSGTRADFARHAAKREAATTVMVQRHRAADALPTEPALAEKAAARLARLERDATQLRDWLAAHPEDRRGLKGTSRKSNRTDNESAKMATGTGVMKGYTGVAAVDARHQVIVETQAYGTGSEHELLLPVVEAMRGVLAPDTLVTADAGYHSEAHLQGLATLAVDALIVDPDMRTRDQRFRTQVRHRAAGDPLHDKSGAPKRKPVYQPADFAYDPDARTCVCPAGKSLYRKGRNLVINGFVSEQFRGAKRDCVPCALRTRCLRTPDTTAVRNVAFFRGPADAGPVSHAERMRERIDSPEGRARYGQRFATVEPMFANVRHNKRLQRFTLRGRTKVDGQWKLFCLVHNIEKLAKADYAA